MKESGLHKNYLLIEKKEKDEKENKNNNNTNIDRNINNNISNIILKNSSDKKMIEMKPVKPFQQEKTVNDWYKKINILPSDDINKNVEVDELIISSASIPSNNEENKRVIFYGMNKNKAGCNNINTNNNEDNYAKFYIYLIEQNDIELSTNEKKKYDWNVTFLCDSHLIGIGLADKNIVKKNNNMFLNDDENYNNGAYCMISTYSKEFDIKEIRPWHCDDKNMVNYVAKFPEFKKGRTINLEYDSSDYTLHFKAKKYTYKMMNVMAKNNDEIGNGKKILTPCILFYYCGDEISFSNLRVSKI